MGNTLSGLTPSQTFQGLIKVGNNTNVDGTAKVLSDGAGTDLPMEVSTAGVNFTGTVTQNGNPISTPPSGVSGAIQFSDGSAFASDAANLFYDDTNKRLGVGLNTPATTLDILPPVQTALATQFDCMRVGYSNSTIGVTNGSALQVQVATTGSSRYSTTLRLSGNSDTSQAFLKGFASNNFGVMLNRTNSNLGLFSDNGIKLGDTTFAGTEGAASGMVHIKGSGSTSATTSLLVQNSGGSGLIEIKDNGECNIGGNTTTARANINLSGGFSGSLNFATINFANWNGSAYARMSGINAADGTFIFGGTSINASAKVQFDSTTKGFLPPRMTTTQKNAIASPAAGLVVYDTTLNKLCVYTTAWETITSL
jgi:hypothetical protein